MKQPVLITFAFAGVFVMGAITGGLVAARVVPEVSYQRASDLFSDQQFRRVAELLQLTPEQRERIKPIVGRAAREVQAQRKEVHESFERMQQDLRKELTEEQRARYDEWRNHQHDAEKRFQHWVREQRAHHPAFSGDQAPGKRGEGKDDPRPKDNPPPAESPTPKP